MNNTCMSSTVSLKYRAPFSFSFNYYSACVNDGYDRNPLLFSSPVSSSPCCSCCCCANSLYNREHISCPSYLFGLRQSNLIHWSARKRLILNGLDRFSYGRYPVCDVDLRSFCEKDYIFKEGKACGKGREIGKGRFRSMVYEEKFEWDGSDGGVNEVEVMLSLLNDDVDDECNNEGEERGKSYWKIAVVKSGNKEDNAVRRRKENVDSGVLESRSEFQYESKMIGSKDGEMRRKEKSRTEKEAGGLLRSENVKVKKENRWENSRQEVFDRKVREQEQMNLSRENQRERLKIEERENLSRIPDHRQRARKDGSSCSSYNSATSDDFEIDNEMQHEQEEYEEGRSGSYVRDSKKNEAIVSHEGKEEFQGHGNYSRDQVLALRKENAQGGFAGASSSVENDWRKKSEKKLSDSYFQGTKSSEEIAQQHSSHRQVSQSKSRKIFGSYSNFHDKKQQSTLTVNYDEEMRQQNDQKIENETRMKSTENRGRFETHDSDVKTYSKTGKLYNDRDGSYYKFQTSVQNESDYHNASGQISKEENYRTSSGTYTETSKLQEVDIRGTITTVRQSGTKIMSQEGRVSSSHKSEEQQHQSSEAIEQLDLRKKYQNVSDNIDLERTFLLKKENDARLKRQEIGSNSSYKSHHKLKGQRLELTRKDITTQESLNATEETIDLSITPYSNAETSVLGDDGTGAVEPLAQMVNGSASVSVTEEAAGEKLHGSLSASQKHMLDRSQGFHYQSLHDSRRDDYGQPSKTISDEDRFASADSFQKSSSHFVGEFVHKVRNEISSSELHEKKIYDNKIVQEDEPPNEASLSSHGSKVPEPKEQKSKSSSHKSETKGPSDQSWDVAEPSTEEPPKAEEIGNGITSGKENVRRTGKSLWHMIGDIILLRWHSRSETQSLAVKSGGKSSPNQSTSNDTCFSGHDPEETIDLSTKSDRISLVEESTSPDYQKEGLTSYDSQGELFNTSNTQGDLKHRGAGSMNLLVVLEKDLAVKNISSFPSGRAISAVKESSPLLLLSPNVSPIEEKISKDREVEGSSSSTASQIEPSFLTDEKCRTDGNNAEVKRREFGRADQVTKDRFDEWDEAYRLETEQRRIDEMFMREALLEAKKAADSWEVPVGAVLVRDGNIIARGYNLVEEMRDSTAHAEINCMREASNVLRTWRLSETTLYVTLEPCPMCAGAILQARIDTVVWGAPNKLLGADGSWIRLFPNGEEGGNEVEPTDKPAPPVHPFHPKIAVRRRVLAAECAETMQQFFQLRRKDKKREEEEPTTPPSCLPISNHPSKFLNQMHHIFHAMFCL